MRRAVFWLWLLLFLAFPVFGQSVRPVSLTVSQFVGFAPMTVRAEIRLRRHAENRMACVELDGAMYLDDCWSLDGQKAQTVFTRWWQDLPSGDYRGQARLQRGSDVFYSNVMQVKVLGDEGL